MPFKMCLTKPSEGQDISTANNEGNDAQKSVVKKKVYIHRNSFLTDMMEVNHLRSIYSMCFAFCAILFLHTAVLYLVEPSVFWEDLGILVWAYSKLSYVFIFMLLFHLSALAFYEGFKLWIAVRNRFHSKIIDRLFLILYTGSFVLTFVVTAHFLIKIKFPFLSGFLVGFEQMRIHMKIYSFVRENAPRVMQYKAEKDGSQKHALYPTRMHYFYYLFAPVTLYRDSYPRVESRNWGNVFYHLGNIFLSFFICFWVTVRFNVDIFKNVGIQPFTKKEVALAAAGCMAVGAVWYFMVLYIVLHSWYNATAELLKLGDREFYQDWWNSTTMDQICRRWNIVVYDWLHTYIYKETQSLGCRPFVSRFLVFATSSLFHDYWFKLSLGFFSPLFSVLFTFAGVALIPLTKRKTGQHWNISIWLFALCFACTCIYYYTVEYYARVNCPKETSLYSIFPRSWDPSCQIVTFS